MPHRRLGLGDGERIVLCGRSGDICLVVMGRGLGCGGRSGEICLVVMGTGLGCVGGVGRYVRM